MSSTKVMESLPAITASGVLDFIQIKGAAAGDFNFARPEKMGKTGAVASSVSHVASTMDPELKSRRVKNVLSLIRTPKIESADWD